MIMQVEDLSFGYNRERKILHGINFSVNRGECLGILGTNGVGKSTLLKCLNRIMHFSDGNVTIDGKDLSAYSRTDLAKKVGYVAQSSQITRATVFDTVLLGRKPYIKWDVMQKDLAIVNEALELLNLQDYAFRYVDELSGGEAQKVAIARALAQEPEILMFDEPTSNLDLKNQLEVVGIIRDISKQKGISSVVTMHDLNLALRFADQFLMMKEGRVFASGGQEVITCENIKTVYDTNVNIHYLDEKPVIVPA